MGKFRVCVAGMVTSAGCIGLGLRFFEVGFGFVLGLAWLTYFGWVSIFFWVGLGFM